MCVVFFLQGNYYLLSWLTTEWRWTACKSQQPRSARICQRNGTQVCTLFALPATIILASASCWWSVKIGRPKAPRNLWMLCVAHHADCLSRSCDLGAARAAAVRRAFDWEKIPQSGLILIITLQLPPPRKKRNTKYSTWNVSSHIPDCVTGQVGTPSLVFVPASWPSWGWDLRWIFLPKSRGMVLPCESFLEAGNRVRGSCHPFRDADSRGLVVYGSRRWGLFPSVAAWVRSHVQAPIFVWLRKNMVPALLVTPGNLHFGQHGSYQNHC